MRNMRLFVVLFLYAFIDTNHKSNWLSLRKCFGANQHVYYLFNTTMKSINFDGDYSISLKRMETSSLFLVSIFPVSTSTQFFQHEIRHLSTMFVYNWQACIMQYNITDKKIVRWRQKLTSCDDTVDFHYCYKYI